MKSKEKKYAFENVGSYEERERERDGRWLICQRGHDEIWRYSICFNVLFIHSILNVHHFKLRYLENKTISRLSAFLNYKMKKEELEEEEEEEEKEERRSLEWGQE